MYAPITVILLLDKKGREAYFVEDPSPLQFVDILAAKKQHPDWQLKTEDWGFFYTAFKCESTNYWKSYDVFIVLILTSIFTSLTWALTSWIEINKFLHKFWVRQICVFSK